MARKNGNGRISLVISGLPPSVWGAYGKIKSGNGRYLKPKAREWKAGAIREIKEQFRAAPLDGGLSVVVTFLVKSRGIWDIDNRFKLLLDALTDAGVWGDDHQINRLYSEIRVDGEVKAPFTRVEVACCG